MTQPAPPMLDAFYDLADGSATIGIPEPGGSVDLPQRNLHDHPFMWALDVFVFAGPDAHEATRRYAQGQGVLQMDLHAYRIMSTTQGVMNLIRVA